MSTERVTGVPGGAQKSGVDTTGTTIDCTALAGRDVKIWSDDQDVWFCFGATAGSLAATTGDAAASATALKADRAAKSLGVIRYVSPKFPILHVKVAASTGLVHVKAVSEAKP